MLMRNFDASDIENGAVRTCREIISRPRISKICQISIECDNCCSSFGRNNCKMFANCFEFGEVQA